MSSCDSVPDRRAGSTGFNLPAPKYKNSWLFILFFERETLEVGGKCQGLMARVFKETKDSGLYVSIKSEA